jgi:thiamine transport system ATP-binding protein
VAAVIRVEDVDVTLAGERVLGGVTLDVAHGETLALLGPSGSGKTTLLRAVAGLQRPDRGRVVIDGTDVTGVPAHRRGVGLVFQDAVLFPHRDVAGNIAFGLAHTGRFEAQVRVAEMLDLVGLPGYQRRSVDTLSGGEAQRVALARALAPAPRILLLDEPLGALDGPLRDRLQNDLREVFARLELTVVHVTHDVPEAFDLGHRVAVLREGSIVQIAPPDDLWRRPVDGWTARFLGIRNVLSDGGRQQVVRPEAVHVHPGSGAVVVAAVRRGPVTMLTVRREDGVVLEAATTALDPPLPGTDVAIEIDPAGIVEIAAPASRPGEAL